jgi:hypothetical protein
MSSKLSSILAIVKAPRVRNFAFAGLFFAFCLLGLAVYRSQHGPQRYLAFPTPDHAPSLSAPLHTTGLDKPEGLKVTALVFFGRKSRVEVLLCYLERNLVENGGWLDEIHWVKNTRDRGDLKYLKQIVASSGRHKVIELEKYGFAGYGQAWAQVERGTMYVKIDDDVLWFADDTIPQIVSMKLAHPEYLLVSANVINSPLMGWVHYHMDALHPYLPEITQYEPSLFDSLESSHSDWRYTTHPNWSGPADYFFGLKQPPPYDGHRWLRMPDDADISRTPVSEIEYKAFGTGLRSWAIAAQEHYSFLENLARGDLDVYKMGSETGQLSKPWIADGRRLSINFIAVWSDDILDNLPMTDKDDEEWLTMRLPKALRRHVTINTGALAVHFSFKFQRNLDTTDLLARYRHYARSEGCVRPR